MAIRKLTKRIFIIANIVTVVLFLLACANAFLHPDKWWFFAILGLAFPFLLAINVGFLLFWLLFRSRWALLPLVALLVGYTNIRALIGFHFTAGFEQEKKENTIRILSWNVKWFDEQKKEEQRKSHRKEMMEFIQQQNADVLCFQEYFEPAANAGYSNFRDIVKLNYPYSFKAEDWGGRNGYRVGVAIFSRFPIIDTMRIRYDGPVKLRAAESLIMCDLDVGGQTVRLFTTHLQSVLLQKKDYRDLAIIKKAEDSMVEASKSIVRKLKMGYSQRGDQVDQVRSLLDKSPYPEIITGDFNDVPNSYTYFRIRGNRQDAFVEKSGGLGRTFSNISPTLRIDYIMADRQFKVLQYKRHLLPYSDHYPVIADLQLTATR